MKCCEIANLLRERMVGWGMRSGVVRGCVVTIIARRI